MVWRIAMDATETTLSTSARLLYAAPGLSGAFYLRPGGGLAGFALRLPLPPRRDGPTELWWEAADLDARGGGQTWLRAGRREVCRPVSVLCAEVPGERPYEKIVLETAFSSWALRLPGAPRLRPRRLTLRLFSEIRTAGNPTGNAPDRPPR